MPEINPHLCLAAIPRLKAVPALDRFHNEVTALLASGDPETFWNCAEHFSYLLSGSCITEIINHELHAFTVDPLYIPDDATEQALTLVRTNDYTLELRFIPPYVPIGRFVRSASEHCFAGLVSSGPTTVERYLQPNPFPHDVFDRSRSLVPMKTVVLSKSQCLRVRAGYDCFAIRPCPTEQIYLFFRSRAHLRLLWEYSTETLLPVKAVATDPASSRLQYASRLLSAMSYREAIPTLFGLMDHPEHFVRWTAVQSIVALDLEKGLEALRAATQDPHPHIRNAALKGLAMAAAMKADNPCAAD